MKPRLSGRERHAANSVLKFRARQAGYKVSYSFMTGRWRIFDTDDSPVIREGASSFTFEEVAMFLLILPVDPTLPIALKLPRRSAGETKNDHEKGAVWLKGREARGTGAPLTWIAAAMIAVLFYAIQAHADPIAPGVEHCVINVRASDVLNMRTKPHSSATVVAEKRHDACGILVQRTCRQNWCPVEDGHSLGWVNRRYIAAVSPTIYCVTGVAVGDLLNLRAFPSPNSRVLARLAGNKCDIAFLPYSVGPWQKIRVGGWQGWVNRRFLSGQ